MFLHACYCSSSAKCFGNVAQRSAGQQLRPKLFSVSGTRLQTSELLQLLGDRSAPSGLSGTFPVPCFYLCDCNSVSCVAALFTSCLAACSRHTWKPSSQCGSGRPGPPGSRCLSLVSGRPALFLPLPSFLFFTLLSDVSVYGWLQPHRPLQ